MIRFQRYAGEAYAGEYVEVPCPDCGDLHCECSDDYRDPEALRAWMKLTEDERQARLAEANGRVIAELFPALSAKVEAELRFTLEMQKRRAA